MIRFVLFLLSLSALATDRYVSPTGTNSGDCSNIAAPCLTIQYVESQMSAGDTAHLRGGTYTSAGNYLAPTKAGTAAAPLTFRAYQGEIATIDAQNAARVSDGGTKRFFVTLPSNTYGSHFHFVGLRFVNWNWKTYPVLSQGNHPGIEFRGCLFATDAGTIKIDAMTDGTGFKILGSQFLNGHNIQCTIDDVGADDDYSGTCPVGTTYLLLNTQAQNSGAATLDIGDGNGPKDIRYYGGGVPPSAVWQGSGHGFRLEWDPINDYWFIITGTVFECAEWTGGSANGDYAGCTNIIVQDTVWDRKGSSADYMASAGAGGDNADGDGLIERVSVRSTNAVADCVDWKYTGVNVNWMEIFGCRAKGLTVWGYSKWRHVKTDSASTTIGGQLSGYISNCVDDGGFAKLTRSSNVGQGPFPGLRITLAGVLGSVGVNGTFKIKDGVSTTVFRIMNDDGSGTSCGGPYSSSPSSTIRMAAPTSGYAGDIEYVTAHRSGGMPGIWTADDVDFPTRAYRGIFHNTNASTGNGFLIGFLNTRASGDNQFYSQRGLGYACDYSSNGSIHRCDLLGTWEPDSNIGASGFTAYDASTWRPFDGTFRATASSPATLVNRGYFAGTNTTESGESRMVVRWRAPQPTDSCTVVLDDSSDFGSLVETINSTAPGQWREVVFGVSAPLSASTTYYHRITCGYDVFSGSAATLASTAGTGSASIGLGTPADASQVSAAIDTSLDNSSWNAGTPAACASGCTLTAASLERGGIYWLRTRRVSAGGATLATSEARASAIP